MAGTHHYKTETTGAAPASTQDSGTIFDGIAHGIDDFGNGIRDGIGGAISGFFGGK